MEEPKKQLPKIKIIGYLGNSTIEEIKSSIIQQNQWITNDDKYNIVHIYKWKNKNASTIYMECSPSLYHKIMKYGKLYVEWERYPAYEVIDVTRCYNCQEYYHKSKNCTKAKACEYCAEEHSEENCEKRQKKCKSCENANFRYKKNYNTEHTASDPVCPSKNYYMEVLKSKIDYGF